MGTPGREERGHLMEIDSLVDIRKRERNVKSDINNVAVKAKEKYRSQVSTKGPQK